MLSTFRLSIFSHVWVNWHGVIKCLGQNCVLEAENVFVRLCQEAAQAPTLSMKSSPKAAAAVAANP
jgi:hypothetical protein